MSISDNSPEKNNQKKGNKKGQVTYIAPLQPTTLASVKTWGIHQELVV